MSEIATRLEKLEMKRLLLSFLLVAIVTNSFAMEEEDIANNEQLQQYVSSRFDKLEIEEGKREKILTILTSFTFDEYINFLKILFGKLEKISFKYSDNGRGKELLELKKKFPGMLILNRLIEYLKSKQFLDTRENIGGFSQPIFKSIVSRDSQAKFIELLLLVGARANKDRLDCMQSLDIAEKVAPDADKVERIEVLKKYGAVNGTKCLEFDLWFSDNWWDAHRYYDKLDAKIIEFYENASWSDLVDICNFIGEPLHYSNKSVGTFRRYLLKFCNDEDHGRDPLVLGLKKALKTNNVVVFEMFLLAGTRKNIRKSHNKVFNKIRRKRDSNIMSIWKKHQGAQYPPNTLEHKTFAYLNQGKVLSYNDKKHTAWLEDFEKFTCWMVSSELTVESFVKHLKAFCNVPTSKNKLPLNDAIALKNYDIIELLLFAGARVDGNIPDYITSKKDTDYRNPLMHALSNGCSTKIIELLLEYGAGTEFFGDGWFWNGQKVVHVAVRQGRLDALKLLKKYGVDFRDLDSSGRSVIDIAKGCSCKSDVRDFLKKELFTDSSDEEDDDYSEGNLYTIYELESVEFKALEMIREKVASKYKRHKLKENIDDILSILLSLSHQDCISLKKVLFGSLANHPISSSWVNFSFHGKFIQRFPGLCNLEWLVRFSENLTPELFAQRSQKFKQDLKDQFRNLLILCGSKIHNECVDSSMQSNLSCSNKSYEHEELDEKIITCLETPCYDKKTGYKEVAGSGTCYRSDLTEPFYDKTIAEFRNYLFSLKDNDKKASNLLQQAQREFDLAFLKLLLEAGLKPKNQSDLVGGFLFEMSRSIENILIDAIDDVYAKTPLGCEIIKTLIDHCDDVTFQGPFSSSMTALHHAVGQEKAIKWLLERGADPNAFDHSTYIHTPLSVALEQRFQKPTLELLLEYGADPTMKNALGLSALDVARLYGEKEALELFKKYQDNEDNIACKKQEIWNSRNYYAFRGLADFSRLYKLVDCNATARKQLIYKKIDSFLKESATDQSSASMLSKLKKRIGNFELLAHDFYQKLKEYIDKQSRKLYKKRTRCQVIEKFLKFQNVLLVEIVILMMHGVQRNDDTLLSCAIREHCSFEIIERLLVLGGTVNCVNKKGDTPLHKAVCRSDLDLVAILLDCGAKLDIKNKAGLTPARLAREMGEGTDIFSFMQEFENENYEQEFCKKFDALFAKFKSVKIEEVIKIFRHELSKYKHLTKDKQNLSQDLKGVIFNGLSARLTMYRMLDFNKVRFNGGEHTLFEKVILSNDSMLVGLFLLAGVQPTKELYSFAQKNKVNRHIQDMLLEILLDQESHGYAPDLVDVPDAKKSELEIEEYEGNGDDGDIEYLTNQLARLVVVPDESGENIEEDDEQGSNQINLIQFKYWFKICQTGRQSRKAIVLKLIKKFLQIYPSRRNGNNNYYLGHKIDQIIYENFFHEKNPEEVYNALLSESDMKHQRHHHKTSFYLAMRCRDPLLIQLFLLTGASPNCHTLNTPLHRAAGWGDKEVVQLLLLAGADKKAKNGNGQTPSQYARRYYDDVATLIDEWKEL